jgi:hypothetical protein
MLEFRSVLCPLIRRLAQSDDRICLDFKVTRNVEPEESWEHGTGRFSSADISAAVTADGGKSEDVLAFRAHKKT